HMVFGFFVQAEDGIRGFHVTGVQTCALPIFAADMQACAHRSDGHAVCWGHPACRDSSPPCGLASNTTAGESASRWSCRAGSVAAIRLPPPGPPVPPRLVPVTCAEARFRSLPVTDRRETAEAVGEALRAG